MITQTLSAHLKDTLKKLYGLDINVSFSEPKDIVHGDYTTSAPLLLSKLLSRPPLEVAEEVAREFALVSGDVVLRAEVAAPGFINVSLKLDIARVEHSCVGDVITRFSGKKVLVEHSSPNLFKPFHVGHLMNNVVGEFLVQACLVSDSRLTTLSFPSDVSLGVAKAMFILLKERGEGKVYESLSQIDQIQYFGDCYVKGVAYFKDNEKELDQAKKIARIIYDINSPDVTRLVFLDVQKRSEDYFRSVVSSLGSTIDSYIYESDVSVEAVDIVKRSIGKVFTESEGAVIYVPDESRKDLHVSVFINSEGHPTYEAKDVALLEEKFSRHSPDLSLTVTDAEQVQHFKVVFDAAEKLGDEWKERVAKSIHVPHGRMTFKGQKMSSRLGGVPLALDVISAVEEEVRERASDKLANHSQEEKDIITRSVALSALRVAILRSKPGININFDPETSLSFEGDSGPYLLYTHARCASLLEKGKEKGFMPVFDQNKNLTTLERVLLHYNEILTETVDDIAPQKMVTYLFKVAQACNSFYAQTQIISDNKEESGHRLAVIAWTKSVLHHGLSVLGIQAVDKM